MLDLLAAISSVDPPSFVAWAVLLFAAGMYPVGIMLGSTCSPCCTSSTPCTTCTAGELPETVTVTFSGMADQAPGPDLITLTLSACYGSGAAARVTAPSGDPETDRGPISAVEVTNGGSGYAKLGRVAPTLTISGGSGTGATFTPTLTSSNDGCGIPSWSLTAVDVTGGSGYVNGETLTITAAEGDTEAAAASVTVATERQQPTLTATVDGGTGATFTVTVAKNSGSPDTWRVNTVTITNGGSGYTDYAPVSFGGNQVFHEGEASCFVRTVHAEPQQGDVTLAVYYSAGSGAVLTPTLAQSTGVYPSEWYVSSVAITNGGAGYSVGDPIFGFGPGNGYGFYAEVSAVGANGEITAISIFDAGGFYIDTGIIESVELNSGGYYYKDSGEPDSVTVNDGGQYFREDASAQPYVASVTVSVSSQAAPSNGTGATFTAEVESSTSSPDFGKVKSVSIANGGDGYLAHELFDTCLTRFDGRSIVAKNNIFGSGPCTYIYFTPVGDCVLEAEAVSVEYFGPQQPMQVSAIVSMPTDNYPYGQRIFYPESHGIMSSDELVADCSNINVTATGGLGVPAGATATITGGGGYEEPAPTREITAEDLEAVFAEVEWREMEAGDCTISRSPCGRNSAVSAGCSRTEDEWCEPWKETFPDRLTDYLKDRLVSLSTSCSHSENVGASAVITVAQGCHYKWLGSVTVSITRSASLGVLYRVWNGVEFNNTTYYAGATRQCSWTYPIIKIPLDPNGLPVGEAVLGDPTYMTSIVGNVVPNPTFWFDDLLDEGTVCVESAPTVTFSALP